LVNFLVLEDKVWLADLVVEYMTDVEVEELLFEFEMID